MRTTKKMGYLIVGLLVTGFFFAIKNPPRTMMPFVFIWMFACAIAYSSIWTPNHTIRVQYTRAFLIPGLIVFNLVAMMLAI